MTRGEFIGMLIDNEIPYAIFDGNGAELIYVMSKRESSMKKAHPRKHKDLYVPYLRVNTKGFYNGGEYYVREDGWCHYMNEEMLLDKIKKLGA